MAKRNVLLEHRILYDGCFSYCEKCDVGGFENFRCEICEENYCSDCSAEFNYFSQIDFNCCSNCANKDFRDYDDF